VCRGRDLDSSTYRYEIRALKMPIPIIVLDFTCFLEGKKWQRDLGEKIANHLSKKDPSLQDVDELMMTITKLVERKLEEAIEKHSGCNVPEDKAYGVKLLSLGVESGLLPSRDDDAYHLLAWFFHEPRNVSHHQFSDFPLLTLVTFVSTANYLLTEIDELTRSPRDIDIRFQALHDVELRTLKITDVSPTRMGEPVQLNAKLEIHMKDPNGLIKIIPMPSGGPPVLEYNTRGDTGGTYLVTLAAITPDGFRYRSSGSVTYTLQ